MEEKEDGCRTKEKQLLLIFSPIPYSMATAKSVPIPTHGIALEIGGQRGGVSEKREATSIALKFFAPQCHL
jgi:hypothetical protein